MKPPVITSMTTNKPSYLKGDPVTLTITYILGTSDAASTSTYDATDRATGFQGVLTVTWSVTNGHTDPAIASVTDTDGRTYAPVSDDGHTAVWQTVA